MNKKAVALELLRVAKKLVSFEFDTKEALNDYLHKHPAADKTLHWIKKQEPKKVEKEENGIFKGLPKGLHTKACGEKLVNHLHNAVPTAKFEVVGSVQTKGQSYHDMDVKVFPKEGFKFEDLKAAMEKEGLVYEGNSLISPEEAANFKKPVDKGKWIELQHFQDESTWHKIEFWFTDK